MLQIRWRKWLTERYLDHWFSKRIYYRMEIKPGKTDNPDQRIAQDVQIFTSNTLEYFFGFLNAIVTLFSFVGILWGLSGVLKIGCIYVYNSILREVRSHLEEHVEIHGLGSAFLKKNRAVPILHLQRQT